MQNHRAVVEHLKKGDCEKTAHPAYSFAAHAKEAALPHSHEPSNKEPLHAYELGRQLTS